MNAESKLQSEILKYLRILGPRCWAIRAAVCNERGVPDILCCYKGQFVGFEVKADKGRLSKAQRLQNERIRLAGGRAVVVRSLLDVAAVLEHVDKTDSQQGTPVCPKHPNNLTSPSGVPTETNASESINDALPWIWPASETPREV